MDELVNNSKSCGSELFMRGLGLHPNFCNCLTLMNDGNVTVYLGAFFTLYERGSVGRIEMIVYPSSHKSRTNGLMSTKQKIPAYKKQQKPVVAVVIVVLQEFVSSLMRGVRLFNICVIILTLCR